MNDLKLHVFHPPVLDQGRERFAQVYEFWKSNWQKTNVEIGRPTVFPSDMLTRQHDVLALFLDEKPISSVCLWYGRLEEQSTLDDSFFSHSWTRKEVDLLRERGGLSAIGSQIMIDPDYRKTSNDVGMKALLAFMALKYAERRGADIVLCVARSDRGVEKAFYEAGGICLGQNVKHLNITLDLIAFFLKEKPLTIPKNFEFRVKSLLATAEENKIGMPKVA